MLSINTTNFDSDLISKQYDGIITNSELCNKIAKACNFIENNQKELLEQSPTNRKIFKISKKKNPSGFSIYISREQSGKVHFFVNLGKNAPFISEGFHKQISHAIKYTNGNIERWLLEKTPLIDEVKKMMAINESLFLRRFPGKEELMQTDLIDTLPDKQNDKQYIFAPFLELGSLEQALNKKIKFSREEQLQVFLDIANALLEMHQNNVAYRDMKPGNILLYKKDGRLRAKVIDFGLSNEIKEGSIYKLNISPYIFSPEMLDLRASNITEMGSAYLKPCDIWALGLAFYMIFFDVTPYEEDYKASRIVKNHHKFKLAIEKWLETNFPEPKNLISIERLIHDLLKIDPQSRPNIEQVVQRLITLF